MSDIYLDSKSSTCFVSWYGGSHLQFSGTILPVIYRALGYGMKAFQIFLGNPYTLKRSIPSSEDIKKSKAVSDYWDMSVFSHFPYISNLAGSKKSIAWNGDSEQDRKTTALIKSIETELNIMSNFKKNGVVIHPGNFPDRHKGLLTIAKSINKIKFPKNSLLLLENSAGGGTSLCTTLDELKTILDNVKNKENIGVCIDTQHLFSVGDYDLRNEKEIDRFFSDFNRIIGMEKFKLLHLNDSKTPLGSCVDRHELIGDGYIWKDRKCALRHLLIKCHTFNIPTILETHSLDMIKINEMNANLI